MPHTIIRYKLIYRLIWPGLMVVELLLLVIAWLNHSLQLEIAMLVCASLTLAFLISAWTFKLEFGDKKIYAISALALLTPRLSVAYGDITRVYRSTLRGVLEIRLPSGKQVMLSAATLDGGGDRLVAELRKHLAPERVDSDLPGSLWVTTSRDKAFNLALGFLIVVMGFDILVRLLQGLIIPQPAWLITLSGSQVQNWLAPLRCIAMVGLITAFSYVFTRRNGNNEKVRRRNTETR